MLPIYLLAAAAFIVYLLARSGRAERGRAEERCRVYIEERAENWTWPPRPRPAATDFATDHKTRTRVGL